VFVLYADEIWSLTLKKEHRMKAFEKKKKKKKKRRRRILGLRMAK
jgi:hypothetical protein